MDFGTAENGLTSFVGIRCAREVTVAAGNYSTALGTSHTLSVTVDDFFMPSQGESVTASSAALPTYNAPLYLFLTAIEGLLMCRTHGPLPPELIHQA